MRIAFRSLLLLSLISLTSKAETTKTVKTTVDKATVYLAGATVFSTEDFNLSPGINQLIFEGVAPALDQHSLQASGKGNFVIMDVKYAVKYSEKTEPVKLSSKNLKAIKEVSDSLVDLGFTIDELNDRLTALQNEKNILLGNRLIKGETRQDTLAMFKDAMEFLRAKLNNINNESYKLKRELYAKTELQRKLNENLQELQRISQQGEAQVKQVPAVYQIIVTAMAETEVAAKVTISYFINQAGWKPSYDIRALSNSNTISVTHKAQLYQNTGIDWNNATLTLATGNPNQSMVKPELNPMYLSFYNSFKNKKSLDMKVPTLDITTLSKTGETRETKDEEFDAQKLSDFTDMVENLIQTEYNIKLKYSIPSDGKEHLVVVQNKEIKAEYNFSAVPKLDANAFLIAKMTNWEDLNLIPGESRIFFDGSYLGLSFIDPNITSDTLAFCLGRDKSIVMTRKKLKDKTKTKFLADEKVMTYSFEIVLKNTKTLPVIISLEDQIPVSATKEIAVKLIDADKADFNMETGKLAWDISLKPNESKKLTVTYEVTFPKNKALAGL